MNDFGGRLLTLLLWASIVVAVPLLGMRWVDSSVGVVAALQSMVPMTGVVVAVLLVIAATTRRWQVTAAAGALLAVCAILAVPSVIRHTVAPGSDDLVVMSANLEFGGADAQSLVVAAREHGLDVLVLLEITPAAVERLRIAGLDSLLAKSFGSGAVAVRPGRPSGLARAEKAPSPSGGCELAIVEQNGLVKTSLVALASLSAPGVVDALGPVVTAAALGVGKSLAVMIVVFAFLLGAMLLGGLLGGASRRRKGRAKRH